MRRLRARPSGSVSIIRWAVIAMALSLVLASCGGEESDAEDPVATETGDANETETEDEPDDSEDQELELEAHQVAFATGPAGGSSFNIGAGMAEVIRANEPNLDVTAEEVSIVATSLSRLARGEVDLTLNTTYDIWKSMNGEGEFEGEEPLEGLNFVMGGTLGGFGIIVPTETGITDFAGLCGTEFGIGSETAEAILSSILVVEGVDPDCINWNRGISYDQIVVGFQDGTLTGAGFVGIPVTSGIQQLVETVDVTFLSMSKDKIEEHDEAYPFFPAQTLPANTLKQQEEDWVVAGFVQGMWTHESVAEDLVYQFAKAVFENIDDCVAITAGCGDYSPERSAEWINSGLTLVPVHPGAARAIEEMGQDLSE